MGKKAAIAQRNIPTKIRQQKALELRQKGMTYGQIADELGYSAASAARAAVESALMHFGVSRENVKALIDLEVGRLDRMSQYWWDIALNDLRDFDERERATNTWIKLAEKRIRLLGLERVKVEIDETVTHQINLQVSHDISKLALVLAGRAIDSGDGQDGQNRHDSGDLHDENGGNAGGDNGGAGRSGYAAGAADGDPADGRSAVVHTLLPARSLEQS